MVVSKNQIRPRRKKFHFSNAEILNLDTLGVIQLVPPVAIGQVLQMSEIQIRTKIVAAYTNIDITNPFIALIDDFTNDGIFFEDFTGVANFTALFSVLGLNLTQSNGQELVQAGTTSIDPRFTIFWNDEAALFANGGIFMFFDNGGSDLADGDPANFLDIFIDYKIINLNINQ